MKFECESNPGEVAVVVAVIDDDDDVESLVNSKLSLDIFSVGIVNDIKSVSLVFVKFRLGFRCVIDGGGANEPLLEDVGNVFPLAYDADGELPNEPGRGRVTDVKLFCAKNCKQIIINSHSVCCLFDYF